MTEPRTLVAGALVGVVVSLLLVGVVSHTPVRHVIQVLPAVIALAAVSRSAPWASYAALPVFAFWLFIMLLIWLFLLGLARVVTGSFSTAEVTLTMLVGASCLAGLAGWMRTRSEASGARKLAVFAAFMLLQVGAMWLSLRPAFNDI